MNRKPDFDAVWSKICAHAGEEFHTVTLLPFTYSITNNYLLTTRTNYKISKNDFNKAFLIEPIHNPGQITNVVRGSSYVYAILSDPRIRGL
jgi:hypothetical protein